MRALGGIPLLIPMPDTYLSMDKGVIDGMDVSWEATYSFRLYEIVKYYTFVPLSSTNFSMVMNKEKWESLPKDIQGAITSVGGLEASKFWGRCGPYKKGRLSNEYVHSSSGRGRTVEESGLRACLEGMGKEDGEQRAP
jgi:hypothetical protein